MINSRKLEDLQPHVREKLLVATAELKKQGISFLVVSTLRDQEYQTTLYNQGRNGNKKPIVTNAQFIGPHGFGLAFDVVPLVAGKAVWNRTDLYAKIAIEMKKVGFKWGGDWKSIVDKPHFEMTEGLTGTQLRQGKRPSFWKEVKK